MRINTSIHLNGRSQELVWNQIKHKNGRPVLLASNMGTCHYAVVDGLLKEGDTIVVELRQDGHDCISHPPSSKCDSRLLKTFSDQNAALLVSCESVASTVKTDEDIFQ